MPSSFCADFDAHNIFYSLDADCGQGGEGRERRGTGWLPLRAALDVGTWGVSP